MNNVYERNGQWFFYDETGDEYGPYLNKELASANSWLYAHWLNTGEEYQISLKHMVYKGDYTTC